MMNLWVDFNEVYDDDYIWTSTRRSGAFVTPESGDWVQLHDDDGASCWGIVQSVMGPIVTCKLDWPTWREQSVQLDDWRLGNVTGMTVTGKLELVT